MCLGYRKSSGKKLMNTQNLEDEIRVASWPRQQDAPGESLGGQNTPAELQATAPGKRHRQWDRLALRALRWEGD